MLISKTDCKCVLILSSSNPDVRNPSTIVRNWNDPQKAPKTKRNLQLRLKSFEFICYLVTQIKRSFTIRFHLQCKFYEMRFHTSVLWELPFSGWLIKTRSAWKLENRSRQFFFLCCADDVIVNVNSIFLSLSHLFLGKFESQFWKSFALTLLTYQPGIYSIETKVFLLLIVDTLPAH